MCGIFGLKRWDSSPLDHRLVVRAVEWLRHRGPDDEGYLLVDTARGRAIACAGEDTVAGLDLPRIGALTGESFDLALGFRRLAIVDLSAAGHQPMRSGDGRFWVVYNGEIYNHIELRAELQRLGQTFRSGSDTEVLLAAFATWGPGALPRLVGMFAFAILDMASRRLFLARDPFGIKPLYYSVSSESLAFASEIKALLVLPELRRAANPQRLYDYLYLGLTDHGDETMFAAVKQVPPAHYVEIDLTTQRVGQPIRYWELRTDECVDLSFQEASERVRDLFLHNIRLHLRSDVPVGSCLSGGIDSSAIVMAMRHLEGPSLRLHTFSAVFDDPAVGEGQFVDLVANASRSLAHRTQPTAEELGADVERLISVQGEPFGSTSIYAQYRVFRLAREHGVKAMLDGQGADELFAGYRHFLAGRLASLVRSRRYREALVLFDRASGLPNSGKVELLRVVAKLLLPHHLQAGVRFLFGKHSMPRWLNQGWFEDKGVARGTCNPDGSRRVLREQLHQALVETSVPTLLRYEDRNSMAFSIESRVPFLTADLVQFVFSLPESYLISLQGVTKAVFRQSMRGIVPDRVLDRRDKIGFATPEVSWLTALRPWVEETLDSSVMSEIPAVNPSVMRQEWRAVLEQRRHFDFRIWRWLNLAHWVRQNAVPFQ